jgi:O-antigen ligase
VAYPLYVPKEAHCGCQEQLVVHNSFVQVLGELGAIGFIPWMVFLGASIFHAWRLHRRGTPLGSYAQAFEIALWGYVVCSLSGGYTWTWFPYLLAGVVAALTHIGNSAAKGIRDAA